MSVLKSLFKISLLLLLAGIAAGAVVVVKRPKNQSEISYDQWPAVPRNPARN